MRDAVETLGNLLADAGWRPVEKTEAEDGAGLDAVFECEYGLLGVMVLDCADAILSAWAPSQTAVAERRRQDPSGVFRDAYLLFVCANIEEQEWEALRDIMNDTHECRKLCISLDGRSLEEALEDLPALGVGQRRKVREAAAPDMPRGLENVGLPDRLLKDLGRRSAETILDRLLAGEYKTRKVPNEAQEDET